MEKSSVINFEPSAYSENDPKRFKVLYDDTFFIQENI